MQIESIDGEMAVVGVSGTRREVSVALLDGPAVGDYVLIHAGFAIKRIDETEAEETARLLNDLAEKTGIRDLGSGIRND
jgi:hydrogenase expression/formation protein HypC